MNFFLRLKDIGLHGFLSSINAIIGISSVIILALFYNSLHFSIYGIFLSVSSIFLIFSKSNLDNLMLTAKSNKDENLCINMFIINFFLLSSFIFFVSYIIYFSNINFLNQWSTSLTFLLVIYIFSNSYLTLMNSYFLKKKNLIIYNLTIFFSQTIFFILSFVNIKFNFFFFFNYIDLIICLTISNVLVILMFYKFFIKKINFQFNLEKNYLIKIKKHKNFYFFGSFTNLFLSIKDFVFVNFIQSTLGPNILGQFIFLQKTFMSMLSLLNKVIGDIYVRNINALIIKKKNINEEYLFFLILASFVSLIIYIIIISFSETLSNFFGEKWNISYDILSIYSILLCFSFVPSILNRLLSYYYQKLDFIWSIVFLLFMIISINFFHFIGYLDFFKFFAKFQLFIYILYLLLSFFVIYKINYKNKN